MQNPFDPRDPRHAAWNHGQQTMAGDVQRALQHMESQREAIDAKHNRLAGGLRREIQRELDQQREAMQSLHSVAQALQMFVEGSAGASDVDPVLRIENIPGRRIPFTLLVDIEIGPDTTSVRQNSVLISQEGPFVATRRMAIFQSAYEYEVTNEVTGDQARLAGRSFGRYRPIHSAGDVLDGRNQANNDGTAWFLDRAGQAPAAGTALPTGALTLPSNASSFRSMEFDGRVTVVDAGSSFPREQISVPTAFWTQELNGAFDLSALDFFERGSLITFAVQPTHVNNPPAGNVDGECIFPIAAAAAGGSFGYPFVEGQYDVHEGICTPNGIVQGSGGEGDYDPSLTDPVSRVPAGVLTLGYEGYRIVQGVAPVP
jgi:hypothetical protein